MAAMTDACPAVRRQGLECLNSLARSHLRELVVNAIPCCPFRVLLDRFGAGGFDARGSYDTRLTCNDLRKSGGRYHRAPARLERIGANFARSC